MPFNENAAVLYSEANLDDALKAWNLWVDIHNAYRNFLIDNGATNFDDLTIATPLDFRIPGIIQVDCGNEPDEQFWVTLPHFIEVCEKQGKALQELIEELAEEEEEESPEDTIPESSPEEKMGAWFSDFLYDIGEGELPKTQVADLMLQALSKKTGQDFKRIESDDDDFFNIVVNEIEEERFFDIFKSDNLFEVVVNLLDN